MKKVLAFDFGASSSRAILGIYDKEEINLIEIHRFPNEPVRTENHIYWNISKLFHEIKAGLKKCAAAGHTDISSIHCQ